jgi:hypothetical protein
VLASSHSWCDDWRALLDFLRANQEIQCFFPENERDHVASSSGVRSPVEPPLDEEPEDFAGSLAVSWGVKGETEAAGEIAGRSFVWAPPVDFFLDSLLGGAADGYVCGDETSDLSERLDAKTAVKRRIVLEVTGEVALRRKEIKE